MAESRPSLAVAGVGVDGDGGVGDGAVVVANVRVCGGAVREVDGVVGDDVESLGVKVDGGGKVLGRHGRVTLALESFGLNLLGGQSLLAIYSVFEKMKGKAPPKAAPAAAPKAAATSGPKQPTDAEKVEAMAALSSTSTLKASAMHWVATSIDSFSSALRVPSVVELLRKSTMARASFFLESMAWKQGVSERCNDLDEAGGEYVPWLRLY